MTVNQLSIFIENKSGTLLQVLNLLKESHIQLIATTVSDTVDYGIYRIICSEPKRAYETLQAASISVNLSEVFALRLDNRAGCAADTLAVLQQKGINISYLYSFLLDNKGILVFRTDNFDLTRETIRSSKLDYISEEELTKV